MWISSSQVNGLVVAGLVLLAIGLERLLNGLLIRAQGADASLPLFVGTLSALVGALLVALSVYIRPSRSQ